MDAPDSAKSLIDEIKSNCETSDLSKIQIPKKRIDVSLIDKIPDDYPEEFMVFYEQNKDNIDLPRKDSCSGKALRTMLHYRDYYWDREAEDEFREKFNIKSKDIIQCFNKHNQLGIRNSSGIQKARHWIVYPYQTSSKKIMRKNFVFGGNEDEKNKMINQIKQKIKEDYIDPPNKDWQLGHKNPDSGNSSKNNLILQPPIQGKYRDNYIWFNDILTKFPVPSKLESMIKQKEIDITKEQALQYQIIFQNLFNSL